MTKYFFFGSSVFVSLFLQGFITPSCSRGGRLLLADIHEVKDIRKEQYAQFCVQSGLKGGPGEMAVISCGENAQRLTRLGHTVFLDAQSAEKVNNRITWPDCYSGVPLITVTAKFRLTGSETINHTVPGGKKQKWTALHIEDETPEVHAEFTPCGD